MAERTVQQLFTLARSNPKVSQVRMRGKNIEINNRFYKPEEFNNIEVSDINPEKAATRTHSWGTSFQGHNAPLSNFYKCEIIRKDKKKYSSAEQYYSSVMAKFHNEMELMRQIGATDNPYVINALAKKVWRTPEWTQNNERILEGIIKAKFE